MRLVIITALICITGLEALAIIKGVNGAIFGLAITAIAGLGGYEIKVYRERKKGGK